AADRIPPRHRDGNRCECRLSDRAHGADACRQGVRYDRLRAAAVFIPESVCQLDVKRPEKRQGVALGMHLRRKRQGGEFARADQVAKRKKLSALVARPPLFNADNFLHNTVNVFHDLISPHMLCYLDELAIPDITAEEIKDSEFHPFGQNSPHQA
ncbi:MAG TPA: hypothetical protein VF798_15830, partial [Burkholderiaceae bacterium]